MPFGPLTVPAGCDDKRWLAQEADRRGTTVEKLAARLLSDAIAGHQARVNRDA